jgi:ParB family transcriptional regulator, chromosome partitioning protein
MSRRRLTELVADRIDAPEPPRRPALRALLGTEDGVVQLAEAKLVAIDRIAANPDQPRQTFDDESLRELAASIAARGILQPIRLRRAGDVFEVVAGERRLRAAKLAGLDQVPAIVVEQEAGQAYLDSLIENIQREDLNPVDRANALTQLRLNLGSVPWRDVGSAIGLSERSVFHLLNLTHLPPPIQDDVRSGSLTEKHGRALHRLRSDPERQLQAYRAIVDEGLTGDASIALARRLKAEAAATDDEPATAQASRDDTRPTVPRAAVAPLLAAVRDVEALVDTPLPAAERRALATALAEIERRLEALRSRLAP